MGEHSHLQNWFSADYEVNTAMLASATNDSMGWLHDSGFQSLPPTPTQITADECEDFLRSLHGAGPILESMERRILRYTAAYTSRVSHALYCLAQVLLDKAIKPCLLPCTVCRQAFTAD